MYMYKKSWLSVGSTCTSTGYVTFALYHVTFALYHVTLEWAMQHTVPHYLYASQYE